MIRLWSDDDDDDEQRWIYDNDHDNDDDDDDDDEQRWIYDNDHDNHDDDDGRKAKQRIEGKSSLPTASGWIAKDADERGQVEANRIGIQTHRAVTWPPSCRQK